MGLRKGAGSTNTAVSEGGWGMGGELDKREREGVIGTYGSLQITVSSCTLDL